MDFAVNENCSRVPFVGSHIETDRRPRVDDVVTLKSGVSDVNARIVEANNDNYKGAITGFEPPEEFVCGKTVGDIIEFGSSHLFRLTRG